MKKEPKPRHGNVRLSLEAKPEVKAEILAHSAELGEWAIIKTLQRAVARSRKLFALEQKGTLLLERKDNGEIEDVGPLG